MKQLELVAIVLILSGIFLFLFSKFFSFWGKLPGDINYSKDNFTFIFPITTSIVISIILSIILTVILNIFGRK
ncbi:MAG: DUF2905 family protein [bacterium]|nr:DUF2905 family protein [bacterium]